LQAAGGALSEAEVFANAIAMVAKYGLIICCLSSFLFDICFIPQNYIYFFEFENIKYGFFRCNIE
jgi:hypothetical protein